MNRPLTIEIKRLFSISEQIETTQIHIDNLKSLPYYQNFNKSHEQKIDLANLTLKLRDLNSQKLAALETIEVYINYEKQLISKELKKATMANEVYKIAN